MRLRQPLLLAMFIAAVPAQLTTTTATGGKLRSTTPPCPLKCPAGFSSPVYTWALGPERTAYDDAGKTIVPPDAVWKVSCAIKCEKVVVNKPTESFTDNKQVCRSGAEPGPYKGPWRIVGQFARECASREAGGCSMHCYEIKAPPAPKKKKR